MDGDDRLDRIELAIFRLTEATEAGFASATQMIAGVTQMIRVLEAQFRLLDTRMTGHGSQMTEVLGRLRIIGEQLATHTHDEA